MRVPLRFPHCFGAPRFAWFDHWVSTAPVSNIVYQGVLHRSAHLSLASENVLLNVSPNVWAFSTSSSVSYSLILSFTTVTLCTSEDAPVQYDTSPIGVARFRRTWHSTSWYSFNWRRSLMASGVRDRNPLARVLLLHSVFEDSIFNSNSAGPIISSWVQRRFFSGTSVLALYSFLCICLMCCDRPTFFAHPPAAQRLK